LLERKKQRPQATNISSNSSVSKPLLSHTLLTKPRLLENPAIKNARNSWEIGINEELIAIATEKDRPFALLM
jgi:hypothetical protein